MLARGKMDGAWAFWQHCCCLQWQLPDSEEEHWRENGGGVDEQERTETREGLERQGEKNGKRKREDRRERNGVCPPCWKFFLRIVAWLENGTLAAPVCRRCLFFCPLSFSPFSRHHARDSVWRLRGAASRYPRDLYRANCSAVNNNRRSSSLDCQDRYYPSLFFLILCFFSFLLPFGMSMDIEISCKILG